METLKPGVSPSPSIYWNVGVSGILRFDLWATTSYGQNLEPEGLSLALRDLVGLDHAHSMEENEKYCHGHVNIGEQKVCGKVEKVVENVGTFSFRSCKGGSAWCKALRG